jgi:hypothetical protein
VAVRSLVYIELIWTRERWRTERDKKENGPVPQGAAKISMGDMLKKFHEAAAKGVKEGRKSGEELKKAIGVYKAAIKTKYPKFKDLIEKKLEKNLDSYLEAAKAILEVTVKYSSLRESASTEMLVAGAEFQHWEKAGSQGTFKPSNSKKLMTALSAFLTAVDKATFCTDKITENAAKLFNNTIRAADGDVWNKPTIEGLVKQLKELPNSI